MKRAEDCPTLVRRALAARPIRATVTSIGVAGCVLLVLLLYSVSHGLTTGVSSFVGQTGADVWVAPRGSDNLIRNSGLLPVWTADSLESLPGVLRADPILRGFVTAALNADPHAKLNLLAIAYRAPDGLGRPPSMSRGARPIGLEEVAIDRATAWRLGADVSDTVLLNGVPFRVAGISDRTNLIATQFLFVDLAAAPRLGVLPGAVSFVVVETESGVGPGVVAGRVAKFDSSLIAIPRQRFVDNNLREVASGFRPMQRLLSIVGILISVLFVALLVHASVEDRRREIAILLAMGTSAPRVALAILFNAGALVLTGGLTGGFAALFLAGAMRRWIPSLELAPRILDAALLVPAFLIVGVAAAAIPLLRLRSVDPVEAFRP
jgi:hypothetical protein